MLRERHTLTSSLESEDEILVLLRSEYVSTYEGRRAGISGSIDQGKTADEQALVEIEEEVGLRRGQLELIRKGKPQVIIDPQYLIRKIVHPYLFHIKDRSKITIDWEHKAIAWIKPEEIDNYETVPDLKKTLAQLLL